MSMDAHVSLGSLATDSVGFVSRLRSVCTKSDALDVNGDGLTVR